MSSFRVLVLVIVILTILTMILALEGVADSVNGTVNGPVRIILNVGRTLFLNNVTITSYWSGEELPPEIQNTGNDGSASFNMSYGETYDLSMSPYGSPIYFSINPNEQDYYVMVSGNTCSVVPASQINVVYPLHSVGATFTQWMLWNIGPGAQAAMYINSLQAVPNQTTDDAGHVNFYIYGNVQYNLLVTRSSDGLVRWFNRTFDGSMYSLDVTGSFHKSSIVNNATTNQTGANGNPDEDIVTGVLPSKSGGAGDLLCNYSDASGSTQTVTIEIYTRNLTDPRNMTLLDTQVFNNNNSIVYNYHIEADPTGLDYYVTFTGTYRDINGYTATVERPYQISFHGPLRVIPGWPSTWYKYLAWAALIVVGAVVGKFAVEEGAVTITVMTTMFYCFNWFYEYGEEYCRTIMAIMWVGSVGLVWLKREREGRM